MVENNCTFTFEAKLKPGFKVNLPFSTEPNITNIVFKEREFAKTFKIINYQKLMQK